MKLPHIYQVLIIIFTLFTTSANELAPRYAKPGCQDKCGNIIIPYPFGIGPNCSLNRWYAVDCDTSKPYLSALKHIPLLGVELNQQTVLVNVQRHSDCQALVSNSSQILNLGGSPFLFSKWYNIFLFEGCGTVAISSSGNVVTGCSAMSCQPYVSLRGHKCDEINCCETNVPYNLQDYSINVTSHEACAFLMADSKYVDTFFPDQSFAWDSSSIPIILQWMLPEHDFSEGSCDYNFSQVEIQMGLHTFVYSGKCSCRSELEEGNPYLSGECKVTKECRKCMETEGLCVYQESYGVLRRFICEHNVQHGGGKFSSRRAFVLGVASIVVLSLTALGIALYKVIQRAKDKKQKNIFFERNGGLFLKQHEARNKGLVYKTKLFSSKELKKATNNFNENLIIGRGGQGTVYKGTLKDGRTVAVKNSKAIDESQLEQFINEVVILSQVNHRNIVKLLGCCLETDVPILVSEFIPNGTLYDHIHKEKSKVLISLKRRIQIVAEIAGALCYLHSAMSIPIYHRDIKTANILLDEEYRAKISDFGSSRFVTTPVTHLTTLVRGTVGYLDPEYFQTSQFSEKSDVYSFGVVVVELLTREKPICSDRFSENRSLVAQFMTCFEEGRVMSILDKNMLNEGGRDVLLEVANLAVRCLNLCGKNRPTMKEVALELEAISMSIICG